MVWLKPWPRAWSSSHMPRTSYMSARRGELASSGAEGTNAYAAAAIRLSASIKGGTNPEQSDGRLPLKDDLDDLDPEQVVVQRCGRCRYRFRVPADEYGEHACPRCWWYEWEPESVDR